MISFKHVGIYVKDIVKLQGFYEKTFNMHYICQEKLNEGDFDFIFNVKGSKVLTTKLITERGKETGIGDMIELIQVLSPKVEYKSNKKEIYDIGAIHFSLECNLDDVLPKVVCNGGIIKNRPTKMWSGNWMCIIQDPEYNYVELLQSGDKIHE